MSQWAAPLLAVPVVEPVEGILTDTRRRHPLAECAADLLELSFRALVLDRHERVITLLLYVCHKPRVPAASDLLWWDRLRLLKKVVLRLALLLDILIEGIEEVQHRPTKQPHLRKCRLIDGRLPVNS